MALGVESKIMRESVDMSKELTSSATITIADMAYMKFAKLFDSLDIDISPDIDSYEYAESVFLNTRSDSADHIIHKLQLAASYFDDTGNYPERNITNAVIDFVKAGYIDNAIYYAKSIANDETIEDYCANPIRAAIADLEAV